MEQDRGSLKRALPWLVAGGAVALVVVALSISPSRPVPAQPVDAAGQQAGGGSSDVAAAAGSPAASPAGAPSPAAAASAWAVFRVPSDLVVRAEEVLELRGRMTLETGPDNEGGATQPGGPPKVSYVWCEADGRKDEEPEPGAPGAEEHAAVFELTVPQTRTYYPWVRVWWEDSCGNSIIVRLEAEGRPPQESVVQDGTLRWWHWVPLAGEAGLELPQGKCRVLVRNREDGARLSGILFCAKSYGVYKPETPEG